MHSIGNQNESCTQRWKLLPSAVEDGLMLNCIFSTQVLRIVWDCMLGQNVFYLDRDMCKDRYRAYVNVQRSVPYEIIWHCHHSIPTVFFTGTSFACCRTQLYKRGEYVSALNHSSLCASNQSRSSVWIACHWQSAIVLIPGGLCFARDVLSKSVAGCYIM